MKAALRALLALALLAPLLPQSAEARLSHTQVIKCNVDGTYTCGGKCTDSRFCCEMGAL
jgi:hypothetical protein